MRQTVLVVGSNEPELVIVREILSGLPYVDIVGEALDPDRALELAAAHSPDVIVASPVLDGVSSLATLAHIRTEQAPSAALILFASAFGHLELLEFGQLRLNGVFLWGEFRSIDDYRKGLEAAMSGVMERRKLAGRWGVLLHISGGARAAAQPGRADRPPVPDLATDGRWKEPARDCWGA